MAAVWFLVTDGTREIETVWLFQASGGGIPSDFPPRSDIRTDITTVTSPHLTQPLIVVCVLSSWSRRHAPQQCCLKHSSQLVFYVILQNLHDWLIVCYHVCYRGHSQVSCQLTDLVGSVVKLMWAESYFATRVVVTPIWLLSSSIDSSCLEFHLPAKARGSCLGCVCVSVLPFASVWI